MPTSPPPTTTPQPSFKPTPTPAPQPNPFVPQTKPAPQYVSKDCSSVANTYWTGYRCACRVGYISEGGICVKTSIQANSDIFRPAEFIYKISKLYTGIECHKPYEQVEGNSCVCIEGYHRAANGNCEAKIVEPV